MGSDDKPRRYVSVAYGYRTNADGSIDFDPDVPADVREEILQQHLDALDYDGKRRELWGEIGPGAMTRLAKLFPSLRDAPGLDPWDALKLLDWLCSAAATSGNTAAGLFVLGVWNDEDWIEVARAELPERQCNGCRGLGVVDRDEGEPVKQASAGRYVRTRYDDDDNPHDVEVQTKRCDSCDGKGTYQPAPSYGRFNLFRALSLWDQPHRTAFETWVRFPFWP
ncbi:MAG: hypothetical protein JWM53_639 [bacterium]|nr:hypothetical protein [bacterium]